jgi:hypothetical protein
VRQLLIGCAAAALAATAADARTVDYAVDEGQFAAEAKRLTVSEFPALPGRGEVDVAVEAEGKLDHQLMILGIYCSAYKVDNPLSQMVKRVAAAWDRDGMLRAAADRTLLRVRFDDAGSTMRCVEQAELKQRCLVRTFINGEVTVETPGTAPRRAPIAIDVSQEQSIGGVCGGLARGAGLSGRAASIVLVERLRTIATGS